MRRRIVLALIAACALAACDRVMELARAATPIDDSGAYILLELDADAITRERLTLASEDMATALRGATPSIRYSGRGVVGDAARVRLTDPADLSRARQALSPLADALVFSEGDTGLIEARLTPAAISSSAEALLSESVAVLQRRVAPFRLSVAQTADGRIIVRSADAVFPPEARAALTTSAVMTFHLLREIAREDAAVGRLPPGTMLVQPYPGIGEHSEIVERRPRITGDHLQSARASTDQMGQFVLAFDLDQEGARQFCRITREYVSQRFAILLDNQVITAPTINEPICGGSGQISGNFTAQSANELAAMLQAGGLPAPVVIVAEGVGPHE